MWKRKQPEPVDLEHVMTETPPVWPVRTPPPAPKPEATLEARPEAPAERPAHARASTLGATLRIKGDLVADEDLVIQGQVEGSILHTRSLTIGAQGKVRGDIRARRIVVEGSVEGNLYALEHVSLRPGATVRGDIYAAAVAMEGGARLIGRIDMDNAPAVPTVKVAVTASFETAGGELTDSQADTLLTGS
jgi:cytoskeletal protein CcmA (bactofilin family)